MKTLIIVNRWNNAQGVVPVLSRSRSTVVGRGLWDCFLVGLMKEASGATSAQAANVGPEGSQNQPATATTPEVETTEGVLMNLYASAWLFFYFGRPILELFPCSYGGGNVSLGLSQDS